MYSGREAVGEIFGQWLRTGGEIHLEVADAKGRGKPPSPSQPSTGRRGAKAVSRSPESRSPDDSFYEYTLREGMIVRM